MRKCGLEGAIIKDCDKAPIQGGIRAEIATARFQEVAGSDAAYAEQVPADRSRDAG
jgi:hypothetical protein